MHFFNNISVLLTCVGIAQAASTFSPARPPSIPIAVKSPYLSAWQASGSNGGNGGYLAGQWTTFWRGAITAWTGLIRVDGKVYTWMGAPLPGSGIPLAEQTSFTYTSTSSVFVLNAGPVAIKTTFLSPVTPEDLKRQSLISSYLNVEVSSTDGAAHDVQLYTDISAEWVSGDRSNVAEWTFGTSANGVYYHDVHRQTPQEFSESNDQAEWGNWYYSTSSGTGVSYQSGSDATVRNQFLNNGTLTNGADTNFRAINQDYPVFGYARDIGSVTSSVSTLFTIGLYQQRAVQFDGANGYQPVPSLWTQYFSSDLDALDFFYGDFATAQSTASALDAKIATDSSAAAGSDYTTITSLALRQAFAGLTLAGTTDQPLYFLKEISSDGNTQTVDVIFPAHPLLLYTNPTLLKYLLEPLLINQAAGKYPNKYSMHDLGSSFPNATGHPDGKDEYMPLEECGNMNIMMLAYYQKTQDLDFLKTYYVLTKQWTGYLIEEALLPGEQVSTDDFAGALANQTNLSLKGILALKAASTIANVTGNTDDAANFSSTASSYIDKWYTLADAAGASPAHTTLSYGNNTSWGLLYNLWSQTLLGLDLVKPEIFTQQSSFYDTVFTKYGLRLDTRHEYTKLDWEIWISAIVSSETRARLMSAIVTWINETTNSQPLTDWYDTDNGDGQGFTARPVVGGVFANLIARRE